MLSLAPAGTIYQTASTKKTRQSGAPSPEVPPSSTLFNDVRLFLAEPCGRSIIAS
jgi:hypothetical protein